MILLQCYSATVKNTVCTVYEFIIYLYIYKYTILFHLTIYHFSNCSTVAL